MGNCVGVMEGANPYEIKQEKIFDPERTLETDPDATYEAFGERRFIVFAEHPESGELLRAQLIRKNVSAFADAASLRESMRAGDIESGSAHLVRWARFWLKEPGSDSVIEDFTIDDSDHTPATLYAHYMSFVQTVGSPGFEYTAGEECFCRDSVEQWHMASIVGKEKSYYFVKYEDNKGLPPEWIHKYSTRLRKVQRYEGRHAGSSPWDTLYELDWIRVRHPTNNQYMVAKVVSLDQTPNQRSIVVQYEDDSLLIRQETIAERELKRDTSKIEHYLTWKRRWRYNRLYIFQNALRSVGLQIHTMSDDNGHSLFRALSHQLFGTDDNYMYLRQTCLDHIVKHKKYFSAFVDINWEYYIAHKRKGVSGEFYSRGDHLDLQAVCEIYDCRIELYSELSPRPLQTERFYQQMAELPLIRLSYRGANHFDSISHIDDKLPLTIERDLRRVPLGDHPSTIEMNLTARLQLMARVNEMQRQQETRKATITTLVTAQGVVSFPPTERYLRIEGMLRALGLVKNLSSAKSKNLETNTDVKLSQDDIYKWSRDVGVAPIKWYTSGADCVVEYPASNDNINDPEHFTLRLTGLEEQVQAAIHYVKSYASNDVDMRVISQSSRVVYQLGKTFKKGMNKKLMQSKSYAAIS